MILLLRIAEIDAKFNKEDDLINKTFYWRLNKDSKVNIVNFVLSENDFIDYQNKLENIIKPYIKRKEKCYNEKNTSQFYTILKNEEAKTQNNNNSAENYDNFKIDSTFKSKMALKAIKKEAGIDSICDYNQISKLELIDWINTIENNSHKLFENSKINNKNYNISTLENQFNKIEEGILYLLDKFEVLSREIQRLKNIV